MLGQVQKAGSAQKPGRPDAGRAALRARQELMKSQSLPRMTLAGQSLLGFAPPGKETLALPGRSYIHIICILGGSSVRQMQTADICGILVLRVQM